MHESSSLFFWKGKVGCCAALGAELVCCAVVVLRVVLIGVRGLRGSCEGDKTRVEEKKT